MMLEELKKEVICVSSRISIYFHM